jgi:hypothetical protein
MIVRDAGKPAKPWLTVILDDYGDELRGLDLGCACKLDGTCHRNVLLRLANQ